MSNFDTASMLLVGACVGSTLTYLILQRANNDSVVVTPKLKTFSGDSLELHKYTPPSWIPPYLRTQAPTQRLNLGHLFTPIHRWSPAAEENLSKVDFWIKRDDFTGSEFSGNKIRKLEFLLAKALEEHCDSVITVGGIQSNHCRATAAAAARVGLRSHLVLRTDDHLVKKDPGLCGNLLVSRLIGAELHLVTASQYAMHEGGWGLVKDLREKLIREGHRPFIFPSGGSCALGVWGYVDAVEEIRVQLSSIRNAAPLDRIYFACGSGGTAAGLSLGLHLSGMGVSAGGKTELIAVGVDDDPNFFYKKLDQLLLQCGVILQNNKTSKDLLRIVQGVGEGYAMSTVEELEEVARVARQTGVVLDPVYSGKAVVGMLADLQKNTGDIGTSMKQLRVLFLHTGGLLGMYDKVDQLQKVVDSIK